MGKECLLQVQNVTKRYGDKIALNDFSMDICPGEIVALIGENGAGKTTLLNIICGYIKPSAGQVQYKGENIIKKPLAIREFGILIEPQLLVCVGTYMILYIIMNLMSYMDGIKYLSPLHYIVAVSSNTLQFTFSTMIFFLYTICMGILFTHIGIRRIEKMDLKKEQQPQPSQSKASKWALSTFDSPTRPYLTPMKEKLAEYPAD